MTTCPFMYSSNSSPAATVSLALSGFTKVNFLRKKVWLSALPRGDQIHGESKVACGVCAVAGAAKMKAMIVHRMPTAISDCLILRSSMIFSAKDNCIRGNDVKSKPKGYHSSGSKFETLRKRESLRAIWVTTPFPSSVWGRGAVWREFKDEGVFREKSDCSLIAVRRFGLRLRWPNIGPLAANGQSTRSLNRFFLRNWTIAKL